MTIADKARGILLHDKPNSLTTDARAFPFYLSDGEFAFKPIQDRYHICGLFAFFPQDTQPYYLNHYRHVMSLPLLQGNALNSQQAPGISTVTLKNRWAAFVGKCYAASVKLAARTVARNGQNSS